MFADALAAAREIFTPPFRAVLIKTLLITLALLALAWFGLDSWITGYIALPYPWLAAVLSFLTGVGLFIGLAFLVAPISSMVAGLFLDELAERVEAGAAPEIPMGRALPAGRAAWLAAKFAAVSLLVNFAALLLLLVPGVNAIVFFVANAYLLGREYFELAALRYRPLDEVRALRRTHRVYLFVCGMFIAGFVAVPILNLLTPLFGTAFMVRVHRRMLAREMRGR
jgi:CysZ protein